MKREDKDGYDDRPPSICCIADAYNNSLLGVGQPGKKKDDGWMGERRAQKMGTESGPNLGAEQQGCRRHNSEAE